MWLNEWNIFKYFLKGKISGFLNEIEGSWLTRFVLHHGKQRFELHADSVASDQSV